MCQYFLDNVTIYNASDDAYIVFLAFFAFVDVNIEYSSKALSPRHAPSMVRFSRMFIPYVDESRAILTSLRCGNLGTKIAVRGEYPKKSGKVKSWWWDESG